MMKHMRHRKQRVSDSAQGGFSIIEFMLVIAVLVIFGAFSFTDLSRNARAQELQGMATQIRANLERVRGYALGGQDARNWGIYFNNDTQDYFELYSTPTNYADMNTTIVQTVYLTDGITFADPTEGNATDVLFTAPSGAAGTASVGIQNSIGEVTISVTAGGQIE